MRTFATLALLLSSVASLTLGASTVRAVAPLDFAGAAVTPADVATFVAVPLDPSDAQITQAQVLLSRITGADLTEMTEDASLQSMLPEELGDLPELENGQAAVVAQRQDLQALMAGSGVGPGTIEDALGGSQSVDPFGVAESISPDDLQAFAVVITADNIDAVGGQFVAELNEEAAEYGDPVTTSETTGGSIVTSLEISDPRQADEPGFRAVAQVEGAVILGFSEESVMPFVTTAEGETPSLADDPGYQAAMAALPADVLLGGYTPGMTADQIAEIQSLMDSSGLPLSLELMLDVTGPTGFAVVAANEGFRIESATITTGGSASASGGTLDLAGHVQADTMLFASGFDLGASQFMRTAEQLILLMLQGVEGDPDAPMTAFTEASIAEQFAGLEMLLGFNPQTDLIQQLTGQYGLAVSSIDLMDPTGFGVLFVSEVTDPAAVEASLRQLALLSGVIGDDVPPVVSVTIGDAQLSQMEFDVDGMQLPLQFGVVDGQMLIGVGAALSNFILGGSQSLADNPVYAEAMGYLPDPQSGAYFINVPEIVNLAMLGAALFAIDVQSSSGSFLDDDGGMIDASERCAEYATQDEAQAAYDDDPIANFDLDFDFDGEACDDYFDIGLWDDDSDDAGTSDDLFGDLTMGFEVNIGGLAMVTYDDGDIHRMSGILVVPGGE
jgi:hypothetical protein